MVAISLYRGNMHRVPDIPRQWKIPTPTISLSQFKRLLQRRNQTLSRLEAENPRGQVDEKEEGGRANDDEDEGGPSSAKIKSEINVDAKASELGEKSGEELKVEKPVKEERDDLEVGRGGAGVVKLEENSGLDVATDKEKRKGELEKKLHVLNEKKHNLVQMLKQILNAEEEIKRRSMQSVLLQAENAVNISSVPKQPPRISVEVNFGGDLGGESDAASNHTTQGRQMHQIHSTSPSAASFNRPAFSSLQHNLVYTPRSLSASGYGQTTSNPSLGTAMVSPSRFAPAGHLGHAASLPSVLVPGTSFVASSPSPAASGGATSGFKDSRLTNSS
ncbi:uncharacterized protein [Typha angustifolia]|uniref:uncharacterized protein n=1 Tax=Typha angustifolia TaxID=59011 RepID=UPI003C2DD856